MHGLPMTFGVCNGLQMPTHKIMNAIGQQQLTSGVQKTAMEADKPSGCRWSPVARGENYMDRRSFIQWAGGMAAGTSLATQAAGAIRMGYFDKYAPFSQRSEAGVMSGALIDGMELLARACGLNLEHFGYPWARAQLMVERGELDGFCTIRTQARLVYTDFCPTPVISLNYGIFHRADDLRPLGVRSVEDLRPLRQGTYRGSGYSKENLEQDRMQIDNDEESILRRIAMGNLDTFVEGELVMQLKLKELGLADKIRFTPAPFLPRADYCFGLRRNHPDIDKVMPRMEAAAQGARKSGTLQAVLTKYR